MTHLDTINKNERGSALWIILLAVALLGMLTVVIGRSSDSTEQTADTEQNRIFAADLMRFSASVAQTIDRMRMQGISENEISFEGPSELTGYTNPNCSVNECKVFSRYGGGISYKSPNDTVTEDEWLFTGRNEVGGVETSEPELVMMLEIPESLCNQIRNEIDHKGLVADKLRLDISEKFTGNFNTPNIRAFNDGPDNLAVENGCMQGNLDDSGGSISDKYFYYQTLIKR